MAEDSVNVLCTTAFKAVMEALAPEFERRSGKRMALSFGAPTKIVEWTLAGEPMEAVLTAGEAVDELISRGGARPESRVSIARSEIAVAVPAGARHPNISTAERFERALREAGSIALSNPAGSGFSALHMQRVLDQLGLTDVLKPKIVYSTGGPTGLIGFLLTSGKAELGIQLKPELMSVAGIEVVGPLPGKLRGATTFALAQPVQSLRPDVTATLLDLLRTSGIKLMRNNGFDPV
jgi:molybdate transport system substrate-binding protein